MDKKQIEEMAKNSGGCDYPHRSCEKCWCKEEKECSAYAYAKSFYEQCYRKITENEIVISKEEYEGLKSTIKRLRAYDKERDIQLHANLISKTRKETAERDFNAIIKALEERKDRVKAFYGNAERVGVDIAIRAVKTIAKQFGVDLREEQ